MLPYVVSYRINPNILLQHYLIPVIETQIYMKLDDFSFLNTNSFNSTVTNILSVNLSWEKQISLLQPKKKIQFKKKKFLTWWNSKMSKLNQSKALLLKI